VLDQPNNLILKGRAGIGYNDYVIAADDGQSARANDRVADTRASQCRRRCPQLDQVRVKDGERFP